MQRRLELARTAGAAGFSGTCAVMIHDVPSWIGATGLLTFAIIGIYGAWPDLTISFPWLYRYRPSPMPLHELAKHVGIHSKWSVKPNPGLRHENWCRVLNAEISRHLISGEIVVYGRKSHGTAGSFGDPLESGMARVDPDFFRTAEFHVEMAMMPGNDGVDFVMGSENGVSVMYRQLEFDRSSVQRIWPTRSYSDAQKNRSPYVRFAAHFLKEQQKCYDWLVEQRSNTGSVSNDR